MKKLIPLVLVMLISISLFSPLVAASPIDDFFNWLRSLFGISYSGVTSDNCAIIRTDSGPISTAANFFEYTCPAGVTRCDYTMPYCPSGWVPAPSGTLSSGQYVKFRCGQGGTGWVKINVVQCQPCGDGILQSNEICDTNINGGIRYQTVSTTQNGCQGTKQQKSTCLSTCDGWSGWTDVSGSFVQTDKCCGVSCSPTTAQCNPTCSGNQWCIYSSSVASCTPTCNPTTGTCGSCSASCGTPSCTITKGQCGVSCSSNSDCTVKTVNCPKTCNGRKYVAAVPTQSCYPTCVNGACTDCSAICPYASGSYVIGECGTNCVADQKSGCGINKCVDGILQGWIPDPNYNCGSGFICQ